VHLFHPYLKVDRINFLEMENVRPQHSLELPIVCKLNDDKRPHVTWGVEPFYGFCHYAAR
jgi:hypothetical protein